VVVVEDEHAMGSAPSTTTPPSLGVTPAAGAGKFTINAAIAGYAPNPNGWNLIGEGVAFARERPRAGDRLRREGDGVLTDGNENPESLHPALHRRRDRPDQLAHGRVNAIGLGRAEVLNPAALQALCSGNQGYMLMTGD